MTIGVTNSFQVQKPIKLKKHKNELTFASTSRINKVLSTASKSKAMKKLLKFADSKHSDSAVHVLISTLGCMIFRPIIIMADKKTEIKDKIYSAGWQFGMALFSLPVILWGDTPSHNLAAKMAEGSLKTKLGHDLSEMVNDKNKDAIIKHLDIAPDAKKKDLLSGIEGLSRKQQKIIFNNFKSGETLFAGIEKLSNDSKEILFDSTDYLSKESKKAIIENIENKKANLFEGVEGLKEETKNTIKRNFEQNKKSFNIEKLDNNIRDTITQNSENIKAKIKNLTTDEVKNLIKEGTIGKIGNRLSSKGNFGEALSMDTDLLKNVFKKQIEGEAPNHLEFTKEELESAYKAFTGKKLPEYKTIWNKKESETLYFKAFSQLQEWLDKGAKHQKGQVSQEILDKIKKTDFNLIFEDNFKKNATTLADKLFGYELNEYSAESISKLSSKVKNLQKNFYKIENMSGRELIESLAKEKPENLNSAISKHENEIKKLYEKVFDEKAAGKSTKDLFTKLKLCIAKKEAITVSFLDNSKAFIKRYAFDAGLKEKQLIKINNLFTKKLPKVVGLTKVYKLTNVLVACTVVMALVTRYMKDIINSIGKLITGKETNISKETLTPEEKTAKKKTNKIIGLMALAGVGLAFIKKSGWQQIGKVAKSAKQKIGLDKLGKALKPKARPNSLKPGNRNVWLARQLGFQEGQKWLGRNILANLVTRVSFNLPTGQYYNTIREFFGEGLGFAIITNIAKSKVIERGVEKIAPKLGRAPKDKGIEFLGNQFVLNWVVVCIVMELLNTTISSNVYKFLQKVGVIKEKEKPEDKYNNINRLFVRNLMNNNQEMQKLYANVLNNGQLK